MENVYEEKYKVTVRDVNAQNVITNYGYLRLMQEAASAHSDALGISPNHFKEVPYAWLILNWRLKVISRPTWNTELTVKTWPSKFDKLYAYRDFEVRTSNGELVAIATSKWVLVNAYTHSIERAPEKVLNAFKPHEVSLFDEPLNKLKEPNEYEYTTNYTIQRSDLDANNHANNIIYLRIATDMLPEDVYNNLDLKNIEIYYKMQCTLGDKLVCMYAKDRDTHTIVIKSEDLSILHCVVKFQ